MAEIAQNGLKSLIFIAVPQVRTEMREQCKLGRKHTNRKNKTKKTKQNKKTNLRMNKSKESTLICMDMYIYTHPRTFKHI